MLYFKSVVAGVVTSVLGGSAGDRRLRGNPGPAISSTTLKHGLIFSQGLLVLTDLPGRRGFVPDWVRYCVSPDAVRAALANDNGTIREAAGNQRASGGRICFAFTLVWSPRSFMKNNRRSFALLRMTGFRYL